MTATRVRARATCGLIKYGSEPNPAERQSPAEPGCVQPPHPAPARSISARPPSGVVRGPRRGAAWGQAKPPARPVRSPRRGARGQCRGSALSIFGFHSFFHFSPAARFPRGEWVVVLFPQSDANLFCRRFHCQLRPPPPSPPYLPHLENSQTTPRCVGPCGRGLEPPRPQGHRGVSGQQSFTFS